MSIPIVSEYLVLLSKNCTNSFTGICVTLLVKLAKGLWDVMLFLDVTET